MLATCRNSLCNTPLGLFTHRGIREIGTTSAASLHDAAGLESSFNLWPKPVADRGQFHAC
jgi:hypothetical protein